VRASILVTLLTVGGFLGWMLTFQPDARDVRVGGGTQAVASQAPSQAVGGRSAGDSGNPQLQATYTRALLGIASAKVVAPVPTEDAGSEP
jgi:hypothetical protein